MDEAGVDALCDQMMAGFKAEFEEKGEYELLKETILDVKENRPEQLAEMVLDMA